MFTARHYHNSEPRRERNLLQENRKSDRFYEIQRVSQRLRLPSANHMVLEVRSQVGVNSTSVCKVALGYKSKVGTVDRWSVG